MGGALTSCMDEASMNEAQSSAIPGRELNAQAVQASSDRLTVCEN